MKLIFLLPLLFCLQSQIVAQTETVTKNFQLDFNLPPDTPDSIKAKFSIILDDLLQTEKLMYGIIKNTKIKVPEHIGEAERKDKMPAVVDKFYENFTNGQLPEFITLIAEYYLNNFSMEELNELKSFYNTSIGKRVQELEIIKISESILASKKLEQSRDELLAEAFPSKQKSKKKKR